MNIKRIVIAALVACMLAACTSTEPLNMEFVAAAEAGTETYQLGETPVTIKVTEYGSGGFVLVALHRNESTSVGAAKQVLGRYGGTLVELIHDGGREVAFTYEGKRYSVDPNRIFTDTGIKRALRGGYSKEVHEVVKGLADAIVRRLPRRVLVALHNNTNGSYSIKSYEAGGANAGDASSVYPAPGKDPDDFFFVTTSALYGIMKDAGYNVVLQSRSASDDGSLSVYAARSGLAYVNVEAEQGHAAEQVDMLEALLAR